MIANIVHSNHHYNDGFNYLLVLNVDYMGVAGIMMNILLKWIIHPFPRSIAAVR